MVLITDATKDLIMQLNQKLRKNCPHLEVVIRKAGVDIKLSLNYNDIRVSYLVLNDHLKHLGISPETVDGHEGKGYNKFLTAVCIFLADTITDTKVLYAETYVGAVKHILSEYKHDKKQFGNTTEEEEEEEDRQKKTKRNTKEEQEEEDRQKKTKRNTAEEEEEENRQKKPKRSTPDEEERKLKEKEHFKFFVYIIEENKKKAEEIMNEWINNKCVRVKKGGKKTRGNKQKRKSKKCKSKRL